MHRFRLQPLGLKWRTGIQYYYGGDGAWIGILPDGHIGVGVKEEGRASLRGAGFVPVWPYMERSLSTSLTQLSQAWAELGQGGIATPEKLIELTVETAWKSRRGYWAQLAAEWALEMLQHDNFNRELVLVLVRDMSASETSPADIRDRALSALHGAGREDLK